jgi:UDP-N-acetylglucosamine 2-epimerase (non-hydrolysing)
VKIKTALIIVGTRPEVIKMAPVVAQLKATSGWSVRVCFTGQHEDLGMQMLDWWGIEIDARCSIMEEHQGLNLLLSKALVAIDAVLEEQAPDIVLVQGDTTSCLAGAMAAFQRKIPVAHVEAGLRTNNKYAPFPEEINRRLVSRLADIHFAPTEQNKHALEKEGIPKEQIFVTGNPVIDALYMCKERIDEQSNPEIRQLLGWLQPEKKTLLVTAHRRENISHGLSELTEALLDLVTLHDLQIVLPVHPNPKVKVVLEGHLGNSEHIYLSESLGYESFVWLMNYSDILLTDSGGIQEEGPSLHKPVLVMREETERTEAVKAGTVALIGMNAEAIKSSVSNLLTNRDAYQEMSERVNPYGDGQAAKKIVSILAGKLNYRYYPKA